MKLLQSQVKNLLNNSAKNFAEILIYYLYK
jgi:hypothetical protein